MFLKVVAEILTTSAFFFLPFLSTLLPSPSGFNNQEVYKKVLEGYRMEAPPKCPGFLYNLMLKCWQEKPEDRPDFNAIKDMLESFSYEE